MLNNCYTVFPPLCSLISILQVSFALMSESAVWSLPWYMNIFLGFHLLLSLAVVHFFFCLVLGLQNCDSLKISSEIHSNLPQFFQAIPWKVEQGFTGSQDSATRVNLSSRLEDAVFVQLMTFQGEKDFCPKVLWQKMATWLCVNG